MAELLLMEERHVLWIRIMICTYMVGRTLKTTVIIILHYATEFPDIITLQPRVPLSRIKWRRLNFFLSNFPIAIPRIQHNKSTDQQYFARPLPGWPIPLTPLWPPLITIGALPIT